MVFENDILIQRLLEAGEDAAIKLSQITPIGQLKVMGGPIQWAISVDGETYTDISGDHGGNQTAQFLRLKNASAETSMITVLAGRGYVASRVDYWSDPFKRYEDWTGSDGIYSFNISTGRDAPGDNTDVKTLFFFGDTLVSKVDEITLRRTEPVFMPNNTHAILDGDDPKREDALHFVVKRDEDGKPVAMLRPTAADYDFEGKGESLEKSYFWMQDGVVIGDDLFCLPSIITEDLTGPEGFQFRGLGVVIAQVPVTNCRPDFENAIRHRADLWLQGDDRNILFGAGIMPYTEQSGYPNPDGYIYIYGYTDIKADGRRSLCVARVEPEHFADSSKWRFFNGQTFVPGIENSAPLLDHVSCEMSVHPITEGGNKGKFLAVFMYDTKSSFMAYSIGETPWGPFTPPQKVFYTDEDKQCETAYMYNAKAHPHLSHPGTILASYNVNATNFQKHIENGHLYRPRFVALSDTSFSAWDRLFSDGFHHRTAWFRELNKSAQKGGIVFVGDSITEEFQLNEMLSEYAPVYNRGIGGDTTRGVLRRMKESIHDLNPSKLFLLIGTNDPVLGIEKSETLSNMEQIVMRVQKTHPECTIHLISILPVNDSAHPKLTLDSGSRDNEYIESLNRGIQEIAGRRGVVYIDLSENLSDSSGRLSTLYTRDGLHLSPRGYRAAISVLQAYLDR